MLKVWGRKNSSNVIPVMWTIGELGLDHTRTNVGGSFGQLDSEMYGQMNPNRTVPTIEDDDFVMWESNAVVRYLSRLYGSGNLWPEDPRTLAEADQWMEWAKVTLTPVFFPIFWGKIRTPVEEQDTSAIDRAVEATGKTLKILDQRLDGREFVTGKTLTIGDIPLGTLAYRYFNLEIDRPSLPNVERWYRGLCDRPAYQLHAMIPFGKSLEEWISLETSAAKP